MELEGKKVERTNGNKRTQDYSKLLQFGTGVHVLYMLCVVSKGDFTVTNQKIPAAQKSGGDTMITLIISHSKVPDGRTTCVF